MGADFPYLTLCIEVCLSEPVRLSVPHYLTKPPPHMYEPEGVVVVVLDTAVLVAYVVDLVVPLAVSVVVVVVPICTVVDHNLVVVVVAAAAATCFADMTAVVVVVVELDQRKARRLLTYICPD